MNDELKKTIQKKWKPLLYRLTSSRKKREATWNALWTNSNMEDSVIDWNIFKKVKLNIKLMKDQIEFDTVAAIDIRICKVTALERVPKTQKLYQLTIDTGEDTRTVVSAIADLITEDELLNKCMAFVVNIKPVKIRGIESQGMILASERKDGSLYLVYGENPGDKIA